MSKIDRNVLATDLHVNRNDFDEEVARQPGLFSYYVDRAAEATERAALAKLTLTTFEGALEKAIRDRSLAKGIKVTEKMIEYEFARNDEWIRRKKDAIAAQTEADQYDGIVKAMAQKSQMISAMAPRLLREQSMGASLRQPQQNENGIPLVPAGTGLTRQ